MFYIWNIVIENVGVRCRVFPDDISFNYLYSVGTLDARLSKKPVNQKEKTYGSLSR